jgi:hypothetical protein
LIEVDRLPEVNVYGETRNAAATLKAAGDLFGDGLELARRTAGRVVESIKKMEDEIRPNEFEVQLAIKLDGEVGAFVVKTSAEAQLHVRMKWIHA